MYGRPVSDARNWGTLGEVFGAALRLGLTSFGGPIAHIGYFRHEYVVLRKWIDDRQFADLLALCQSLPGPASSQLGIAIGATRAGVLGGIVSWVGFTMPSAIAMVLFALLTTPLDIADAGWIHGLKLAAVAVVAQAVAALATSLTPDGPRRAIALVGAAVALAWKVPLAPLAIIAGGAIVGWIALRPPSEEATPIDRVNPSPIGRRTGLAALAIFLVLLVGLPIARSVTDSPPLAMVESLYRTGSLVFGGGHVVLPLLRAGVVESGWVSEDRFLAGYGAAQAVPGPLFSFAAYLGAVATPLGGWGGAATALISIYLPSFLLIFGVLPFWARLRRSAAFRQALTGTNAAVVGLLAAALYRPIWTAAVTTWLDVGVVIVALALLVRARLPPIVVVFAAAAAGQVIGGAAAS
jgi:chromate transporter